MSESSTSSQSVLTPDEKATPVMACTASCMVWGDVITKEVIRVSTWLRTAMVPDRIHFLNARWLLFTSGSSMKPMFFKELYLPTVQINVFHLIPPAKDPLDYDPAEPNRKMEPITALVGSVRVDGNLRIAVKSDLARYLDSAHEAFSSIYDAEVSYPSLPVLGSVRVPLVLVRMTNANYAVR